MATIDFDTVLQVAQIIVTLLLGLSGFLIKRELTRLDQKDTENQNGILRAEKDLRAKIDKTDNAVDVLAKCVYDFKENIGKEFVRKSDFAQTNGEIVKRLDKIYDLVYALQGGMKNG